MSSATSSGRADWREDPRWRLIEYDPETFREGDLTDQPSPRAELANPPVWASAYDGRRIVATWALTGTPAEGRATVVPNE